MKNLFLDSNIWLSLYHFSGDDLEQFSKLKELNGTILKIYIPEQTRNEVQRNRDAKIKDAMMNMETFINFIMNSKESIKNGVCESVMILRTRRCLLTV